MITKTKKQKRKKHVFDIIRFIRSKNDCKGDTYASNQFESRTFA